MNELVPDFHVQQDYPISTSSPLPRPSKSPMAEEEIMELLWQNGQVVMQSQRSLKKPEQPLLLQDEESPSAAAAAAQHLFMQEDEMASWLHYPMEDDSSFDHRDFYSDIFYPTPPCPPVSTPPPLPPLSRPLVLPPRQGGKHLAGGDHLSPSARQGVEHPSLFASKQGGEHPSPPAMQGREHPSLLFGRQSVEHPSLFASQQGGEHPSPPTMQGGEHPSLLGGRQGGEHPSLPAGRKGCEHPSVHLHNFAHFSRAKVGKKSMVDSSVTPVGVYDENLAERVATSPAEGGVGRETGMSSPGGSGGSISASAEQLPFPVAAEADRKRKRVEADDTECQSEDLEFESPNAKKQTRGSTSTKRSRAAEVHNLSERRRRDRINEKMRALQELIPRCNKSDKASMLDEAIEYLKSLQMQVQMMSMGCGMVPMMFPGVQQYMPPMGMGMGMEMGINRPMIPFLPMMCGSALPNSATTAHLGPRFHMPAYHMQSVPLPNPSGTQATNQPDPMINLRTRDMNQPHMQFFSDPYQQYLGLQQVPLPQNQVTTQPSTSRPGSGREAGNHKNPKSG